ncbi:MAG: hypothetical protein HYY77_22820 [Betaproteobacteria bacterium]|nr:hypothetical protein [Betaproteobacteria bacterium]
MRVIANVGLALLITKTTIISAETGLIPVSSWFEQLKNYSNIIDRLDISQAHYLSLMESVKKVFPQEWVAKELEKHDRRYPTVIECSLLPGLFRRLVYNPVAIVLGVTCGGFGSLVPLIRLGQLIQAIEGEASKEQLFQRLRGAQDDYMGALFELEVFEAFKNAGFSLKKAMEADGVDFTFQKNSKEILIEATHRGASWILDLVDEIFRRSFQREFGGQSNRSIRLKLKYRRDYYTDAAVEEIVKRIVEVGRGFSGGFEDPQGNYSISQEKSEKHTNLAIGWNDRGGECVYEAKDLFKSKLQDKTKLKQLLINPGTYCAIDMRALMPCILAEKKQRLFQDQFRNFEGLAFICMPVL